MENQVELRREVIGIKQDVSGINAKLEALLAHFGVGKSAE